MVRPKFIAAAAAFLMFEGELMAGKRLLPDFGGSAYVWYSTVLFFQLLLIAGYYGSRQLGQAPARARNLILAVLCLSGGATLFRAWPVPAWLPAELQPMAALLPFAGAGAALFCVTPLLHHNQADQNDYSIYAWSNAGALLGLILYPLAVEPLAGLTFQNWVWAVGVLLIGVALPGLTPAVHPGPLESGIGKTRWEWWVLPALSSATMLAATNQISYEASPGPLAWALTLGLFLASFVWAFSRDRRESTGIVAAIGLAALIATHLGVEARSAWRVVLLLTAGGTTMMACHVWLASTKNTNSHGFYSALAIGGAAGSAVMVLVVPRVTDGPIEFPILVLVILSVVGFRWSGRVLRPIVATIAVVAIGSIIAAEESGRSQEVARARTLYGFLRVTKTTNDFYKLLNNATLHGAEDRRHPEKGWTYYDDTTGIARLMREREARQRTLNIGVIGLGAGTINRLLRPQDSITYYEINPKVPEFARKYFSYLRQPATRIVIGDGRQSLQKTPRRDFDVLVVDAFSGDAIPTHLLTREAGQIYRRRLKPGGVLAVHISNAHVDLLPVVRGLARSMDMKVELRLTLKTTWTILIPGAEPPNPQVKEILWTDDRNSILPVLKSRPENPT